MILATIFAYQLTKPIPAESRRGLDLRSSTAATHNFAAVVDFDPVCWRSIQNVLKAHGISCWITGSVAYEIEVKPHDIGRSRRILAKTITKRFGTIKFTSGHRDVKLQAREFSTASYLGLFDHHKLNLPIWKNELNLLSTTIARSLGRTLYDIQFQWRIRPFIRLDTRIGRALEVNVTTYFIPLHGAADKQVISYSLFHEQGGIVIEQR